MADSTDLEDIEIEALFSLNIDNTDHNLLRNRDMQNQHPISAITGLSDELGDFGASLSYEQSNLSLLNKDGDILSTVKVESGAGGDIDGGSSTSVYLQQQVIDGGSATEGE